MPPTSAPAPSLTACPHRPGKGTATLRPHAWQPNPNSPTSYLGCCCWQRREWNSAAATRTRPATLAATALGTGPPFAPGAAHYHQHAPAQSAANPSPCGRFPPPPLPLPARPRDPPGPFSISRSKACPKPPRPPRPNQAESCELRRLRLRPLPPAHPHTHAHTTCRPWNAPAAALCALRLLLPLTRPWGTRAPMANSHPSSAGRPLRQADALGLGLGSGATRR